MKYIFLSASLFLFSFSWLPGTIKDNWARDAHLGQLLEKVQKLNHSFYRTSFNPLIKSTIHHITEYVLKDKESPYLHKDELKRKIEFLEDLIDCKIFYSCMTDTDMSNL